MLLLCAAIFKVVAEILRLDQPELELKENAMLALRLTTKEIQARKFVSNEDEIIRDQR